MASDSPMTLFRALVFAFTIVCHIVNAHQSRSVSRSENSTNVSSDGLTVLTQQGPVVGSTPVADVRQFLGIPYAMANRWEAPMPAPNRTALFNASSFGDSCPQQWNVGEVAFYRITWGGLSEEQIFVPESEDCLSVNIWAPSINRAQSTAVLGM